MASQSLIQISDLLENNSIVFEQDIPDRLKCVICVQTLKNAKQTSCGCKVCEKCINKYLKDGEMPCPSKQPDCAETKLMLNRDINQDNATNREISNLIAKCPFNSCTVKESLKVLLIHIDSCEHGKATCGKCSKKYPPKNKSKHDQSECDKRIMICKHCQKRMTAQKLNDAHLDVDHEDLCSEYIGDCKNGCGEKSVNLRNHLSNCTKGQSITVGVLAHPQIDAASHLPSVVTERDTLRNKNQTLSEENKRLRSRIKELLDSRQKIIKAFKYLKKKCFRRTTPSQKKNVVFRNAIFIWKITDYESLKHDAENNRKASITSDSFYMGEFGYKMCLRIYPTGDGVGRGTHLSVFFAIMKGDYDDILPWPFRKKVTISLIDQQNNGAKNHSEKFKPDARSACNQKPVDDCNIASGSPKFISLNTLIPNSIYYKNDTLFLKITVDTLE